jgi:hypothetical protein
VRDEGCDEHRTDFQIAHSVREWPLRRAKVLDHGHLLARDHLFRQRSGERESPPSRGREHSHGAYQLALALPDGHK